MRLLLATLSLCLMMATAARAQDPLQTDGDKYSLVLENERVRVLKYLDKPGEKTSRHVHPDFVLHALAPFKRRLVMPDGTKKEREFKAGEVVWMPGQSHIGENIGTTETNVIIVELKEPPRASKKAR